MMRRFERCFGTLAWGGGGRAEIPWRFSSARSASNRAKARAPAPPLLTLFKLPYSPFARAQPRTLQARH